MFCMLLWTKPSVIYYNHNHIYMHKKDMLKELNSDVAFNREFNVLSIGGTVERGAQTLKGLIFSEYFHR